MPWPIERESQKDWTRRSRSQLSSMNFGSPLTPSVDLRPHSTPKSLNHHHYTLYWILSIGAAFTNRFVIFCSTLNNEKDEYANRRPLQFNASRPQGHKPQVAGARVKYVEEELRQRSQNGDWNPFEATRRNTTTYVKRQKSPKEVGFEFGPSTCKAKFRKAVREHLLLFIQNLDVHLLFFTSTSESFGVSPSRNTKFISFSHWIKISTRKSVIEVWVIHTLDRDACFFSFFDESKAQGVRKLCHNKCSFGLDGLLVSYI